MTLIDTRSPRERRTAIYIAALVAAYLAGAALVKVIMATIVGFIASHDLYAIGNQWSDFASSLFRFVLVFAVGVFLVLWLLAPISAAVSLRLAIARAALALAGGAVLVFFVSILVGVTTTVADNLFYDRAPGVDGVGYVFLGAIQGLVSTILDQGPLVLLAAVLVWLRLRARSTTAV